MLTIDSSTIHQQLDKYLQIDTSEVASQKVITTTLVTLAKNYCIF